MPKFHRVMQRIKQAVYSKKEPLHWIHSSDFLSPLTEQELRQLLESCPQFKNESTFKALIEEFMITSELFRNTGDNLDHIAYNFPNVRNNYGKDYFPDFAVALFFLNNWPDHNSELKDTFLCKTFSLAVRWARFAVHPIGATKTESSMGEIIQVTGDLLKWLEGVYDDFYDICQRHATGETIIPFLNSQIVLSTFLLESSSWPYWFKQDHLETISLAEQDKLSKRFERLVEDGTFNVIAQAEQTREQQTLTLKQEFIGTNSNKSPEETSGASEACSILTKSLKEYLPFEFNDKILLKTKDSSPVTEIPDYSQKMQSFIDSHGEHSKLNADELLDIIYHIIHNHKHIKEQDFSNANHILTGTVSTWVSRSSFSVLNLIMIECGTYLSDTLKHHIELKRKAKPSVPSKSPSQANSCQTSSDQAHGPSQDSSSSAPDKSDDAKTQDRLVVISSNNLDQLKKDNSDLHQEKNKLIKKYEKHKQQLTQIEAKRQAEKELVAKALAERDEFKQTHQRSLKQVRTLEEDKKVLSKRIDELSETLGQFKLEAATNQKHLQSAQSKSQKLSQELEQLTKKFEELTTANQDLEKKYQSTCVQKKQSAMAVQKLQHDFETLKDAKKKVEDVASNQKTYTESVLGHSIRKNKILAQKEIQIVELENQIKRLKDEKRSAEAKLSDALKAINPSSSHTRKFPQKLVPGSSIQSIYNDINQQEIETRPRVKPLTPQEHKAKYKKVRTLLAQLEQEKHHRAFISGGFVRGVLAKKPFRDIDIITTLPADWVKKNYRKLEGFNFKPVDSLPGLFKDYDQDIDLMCIPNLNLKEHAQLADFTFNALLINSDGALLDVLGRGYDAINYQIFETTSQDHIAQFKANPAMMLRLIRFNLELDWAPPQAYLHNAFSLIHEVYKLPYNVFRGNFEALFSSDIAQKSFENVYVLGVVSKLFGFTYMPPAIMLDFWQDVLTYPQHYQRGDKQVSPIALFLTWNYLCSGNAYTYQEICDNFLHRFRTSELSEERLKKVSYFLAKSCEFLHQSFDAFQEKTLEHVLEKDEDWHEPTSKVWAPQFQGRESKLQETNQTNHDKRKVTLGN